MPDHQPLHVMLWMYPNFDLLFFHLESAAMFPLWNYRPWAVPQGPPDQSMWNPMANTGLPHLGMGGYVDVMLPSIKPSTNRLCPKLRLKC